MKIDAQTGVISIPELTDQLIPLAPDHQTLETLFGTQLAAYKTGNGYTFPAQAGDTALEVGFWLGSRITRSLTITIRGRRAAGRDAYSEILKMLGIGFESYPWGAVKYVFDYTEPETPNWVKIEYYG